MKPITFVVFALLALAARNPAGSFGGSNAGNTAAAGPVTPDAVIVNGVTYVQAGGPAGASVPSASPTAPTAPAVTPTTASPVAADSELRSGEQVESGCVQSRQPQRLKTTLGSTAFRVVKTARGQVRRAAGRATPVVA
jgi:hypothetical protein